MIDQEKSLDPGVAPPEVRRAKRAAPLVIWLLVAAIAAALAWTLVGRSGPDLARQGGAMVEPQPEQPTTGPALPDPAP